MREYPEDKALMFFASLFIWPFLVLEAVEAPPLGNAGGDAHRFPTEHGNSPPDVTTAPNCRHSVPMFTDGTRHLRGLA